MMKRYQKMLSTRSSALKGSSWQPCRQSIVGEDRSLHSTFEPVNEERHTGDPLSLPLDTCHLPLFAAQAA